MILENMPRVSSAELHASFVTDENGYPLVTKGTRGRNHYKIRLWIDKAPEGAYSTTYVLDPSYRDPVRDVLDGPAFELETTAYGDYRINVVIRRPKIAEEFAVDLSDVLAAQYRGRATPAIVAALEDVKSH